MLERLDHWAVSWQNTASSKLARILEQNSYDHQAASRDNKQLERIVLDAFDKCTAMTDRDHKVKFVVNDERRGDLAGGNVSSSTPALTERGEKSAGLMSADERPLAGCEDPNLVESGVSKVFRVGSAQTNEAGRDFNIRYCNQETLGGGWTVGWEGEGMKYLQVSYNSSLKEFPKLSISNKTSDDVSFRNDF